MKCLAIIPARGGSKRIPRKNIKDFLGKPIIAYSIETALQSGLFSEVIVSTDDDEIADISKKFGASVPFMRSKNNSSDSSTTDEVLGEVLHGIKKSGNWYENVCCIYPTAPLLSTFDLQESFNLMINKKYDLVFPVCSFSYPIFRAMKVDANNKVEMIWPENLLKRTQDFPAAYHDAGQFYWFKSEVFIKNNNALSLDNAGVIILEEQRVQDIDNESDWKEAEIKYKLRT